MQNDLLRAFGADAHAREDYFLIGIFGGKKHCGVAAEIGGAELPYHIDANGDFIAGQGERYAVGCVVAAYGNHALQGP